MTHDIPGWLIVLACIAAVVSLVLAWTLVRAAAQADQRKQEADELDDFHGGVWP